MIMIMRMIMIMIMIENDNDNENDNENENENDNDNAVILLPLHPASLTEKNLQRNKIICGTCSIECRDRLSDLKMFL